MINFSGIARSSTIGSLARLPLRLIPSTSVVPVLQGPLRGKRWVAGSSTHGCWLGSFESKKQRVFLESVRPGSVVFDIGANVGFYTLLASLRASRVYSFEPLPVNITSLHRHLSLNAIANVTVFPVAVADFVGASSFDSGTHNSEGCLSSDGKISVPVSTLDQLNDEKRIPHPQTMKIDVEGAELLVLKGGARLITESRPTIFLATHGEEIKLQCMSLLREWGYSVSLLDQDDELVAISCR